MEKFGLNLVIHVLEGKMNQKMLAMFSWKMTLIIYWYSVSDKNPSYEAWSRNLNGIILFQIHTL